MTTRIVFGTSELMRAAPAYQGQQPVFSGEVDLYKDERAELVDASTVVGKIASAALAPADVIRYSTGRLEQAIGLGYEVYVCSLKAGPGPHDAWWMDLVPPDRVFYYEELGRPIVAADLGRLAYLPWQRLFAKLGIPWTGECERVASAKKVLAAHGVLLGDGLPANVASC